MSVNRQTEEESRTERAENASHIAYASQCPSFRNRNLDSQSLHPALVARYSRPQALQNV